MHCTARIEGETGVVSVEGRLESSSVSSFRETVLPLSARGCVRLIFDFSHLEFLDGQGLASLLTFYRKWTRQPGGRVVLSGLNPEVRQFLDRTSLSRVLLLTSSLEEAMREVRR